MIIDRLTVPNVEQPVDERADLGHVGLVPATNDYALVGRDTHLRPGLPDRLGADGPDGVERVDAGVHVAVLDGLGDLVGVLNASTALVDGRVDLRLQPSG